MTLRHFFLMQVAVSSVKDPFLARSQRRASSRLPTWLLGDMVQLVAMVQFTAVSQ